MNGWSAMFDAVPSQHPLDPSSSRTHSNGIIGPRPTYQTQSRPSLSRLTGVVEKEVAEAVAAHRGSPLADGGRDGDVKGKGRATEMIEVIVHKVGSDPVCDGRFGLIGLNLSLCKSLDYSDGLGHGGSIEIWHRGPSYPISLQCE